MTTWDVFTGSASVPSGALTELAALRAPRCPAMT